jgi:hypothetical protein
VFPKGHEGRGWAECTTKLRKVHDFFAKSGNKARPSATAEGSVAPKKPQIGGGRQTVFCRGIDKEGTQEGIRSLKWGHFG